MKIFILNPFLFTGKLEKIARKRQPLDLAYIASLLRKEYEVNLVDANALNYTQEETLWQIENFKPDILILTSTPIDRWEVPSHEHIKHLIKNLIEITNKAKVPYVIVLGAHGTLTPKWILENTKADFVVRGEPEMTTYNLVREIAGDKNYSQVKGISYFNKSGHPERLAKDPTFYATQHRDSSQAQNDGNNEILKQVQDDRYIHNEDAPRIENLDELPFPAYDLLPMDRYRYTFSDLEAPFSIMMSSRGCPFSCTYCLKVMMPNKYITRSPASVLAEMVYLQKKFGVKSIYFQDWEFLIDKKRVSDICDWLIEKKIGITWGCNSRASDISEEIVAKMKAAGCVRVNIGFESGSQKVLDKAKKFIKVEQMEKAFSICRQYGIHFGIYSIINLPGEDASSIRETEEFLERHKIETMCSPNLPIPYFGTELYEMLKEQTGKSNFDWSDLDEYTGKVGTKYDPWIAKFLRWHYKYRAKYGWFYWTYVDFQKQMVKRILHL